MWNKIYTGALGISFLLTAGLIYYSYTWLQSIGAPASVAQNYENYSNISWMFLWISSAVLLVLANVVLWTTGNAWAMWATFLYFAVFILAQTLWLDQSFFSYKQQNNLTNSAFSLGIFSGVLFSGLAGIIVFFNQYLVKRMRNKMFQTQIVSEVQTESELNNN
jgi:hypothetical protein